ncbi:hypothetical protein G6F57_009442 [Rhizopus arrhizus]|uniref:Tyr recombinase domain-containing protein n=1 Tax=Rhizopus oryzae TaxID=64495 RepID=A0A9P7BN74_RHIOR|nr:hypothetical protein G6F23_011571 [Rhizopus arrhizus]KAG0755242.1 hypothetical protein G6F24_011961 [Rhizopus arrhizus]KAG0781060.1 hypothetical protein G6F21_011842 [Rhizopus arrhizus]KAG0806153.1 hypothetical protein G6F20_011350 [Rhizopus arrhizus]KAG0825077.1 hypothetical protein G6F19_010007 [Rhizopus arrhizus]
MPKKCLTQFQVQDALELSSRPRSQGSGCFLPSLAQEGFVSVSTVATDTEGFTTNSVDEVEGSGIGHPVMADPILVSDTITNETSTTTADIQDKEELDSSRLALTSNKWTSDGISKCTRGFFLKANCYNTHRAYSGIWKKFSHWYQKQMPVQDPEEYNVSNVLCFLMEHNRLSAQMLNSYRSAIASPEIALFFKAKKDTEVRIPTVKKLETWDINILILYIRKELSPSNILTLGQLQLKVILLVCINTMWRPRSDVGRIQWIDVQFTHTDGIPDNVWLHIRQPKETNTKNIQLGVIQEDLSVDHTLFLGYLEVDTKPTTSVQPSTVGKWVQTAMEKTGVDRRYKPHSLRSATSRKAVMLGVSIDQVKDHANWSRNSNTFEKFYYKPPRRCLRSMRIQQSIFFEC